MKQDYKMRKTEREGGRDEGKGRKGNVGEVNEKNKKKKPYNFA